MQNTDYIPIALITLRLALRPPKQFYQASCEVDRCSRSTTPPQALPVKSVSVESWPQVQAPIVVNSQLRLWKRNLPLARFPQMQASPLMVFSWGAREQVHSPASRFPGSRIRIRLVKQSSFTNRMSRWRRRRCSRWQTCRSCIGRQPSGRTSRWLRRHRRTRRWIDHSKSWFDGFGLVV